jgi:hypothetical protein
MKKSYRSFVLLALLAALVVPAARADQPQKLDPSDVKAIDTKDSESLAGFKAVFKGKVGVTRGCPIVKAHPQARAVWGPTVDADIHLAQIHGEHFNELADEVDAFLKQTGAYPDPADRKQLDSGVADMALGLRMRAGAVDKYISALKKAETLDCASFDAIAGGVQTLINKSYVRYVTGFDDLIHLALGH